MLSDEKIQNIRALGSDGTFEEDLKVMIGCAVIGGEVQTIGDLQKMKDDIVGLHEWHMHMMASQI